VTLIGEGDLPFFERTVREGYFARIEPFTTRTSKELWASLATGQLPHRHGVTGGYSYVTPLNPGDERFLILPSGVGFRVWGLIPPVRKISAELPSGQSLPFWRMFDRLGIRTAVVNWPGMPPLRESERASPVAQPIGLRLSAAGRGTRIQDALRTDLAAGKAAEQALASSTVTAVALTGLGATQSLLRIESNDLPGSVTPRGAVIRTYLQQVDAILGKLQAASPEALIVVVSSSGPDPSTFPGSPVGILKWLIERRDPGANDGFILLRADGVRAGEGRQPARITDVVPTLLFATGLPVARDFDGRVLTEAFEERFLASHALSIIQTYEAERIAVRRGSG
jgi:hypothetical protein